MFCLFCKFVYVLTNLKPIQQSTFSRTLIKFGVSKIRQLNSGAEPGISERGGGGLYTINECHLFMSLVIPEPDTTFAKCTLSFHNLTNSRMVKVK